ncbi:conserved hypothetical protein [Aggregatibacter segnis ATCC 33393]|uniref:Uncharacterized protein n=1 Tax=Aggregatibacter segnis ATCC 33393 TaxID=888057 RepID=E6KYM5_9PAST|nr:conserved hypothetical protein [Aggregatibacter segnis ATCC 33393]
MVVVSATSKLDKSAVRKNNVFKARDCHGLFILNINFIHSMNEIFEIDTYSLSL